MMRLSFLLVLAPSVLGIELTPDNFEAETFGKTVFLKFFAPWCGHCKAMKSDWEQLMGDFKDSSTQLVAEIDCTAEGEELCNEFGIEGFPTLKWGDPNDLETYEGGRSYEDLKAFADENLKPLCNVKNIDLCEGEEKELIEKFLKLSEEELRELVNIEDRKMEEAEETYQAELEKLQATFDNLDATLKETIDAIKNGGLSLMKSVLRSKESTEIKEEL